MLYDKKRGETTMKLTCLIENTGNRTDLHTEHGLSLLIETDCHKVLFDTGATERFIENAEQLSVPLSEVDTLVLSHGHYDHTGGIRGFLQRNDKATVYIRENAFAPFYHCTETGMEEIGIRSVQKSNPRLTLATGNLRIDEELMLFTNVKGRKCYPETNFKLKYFNGNDYVQDDFRHEQNLVVTERGTSVLFAGCSHNGIVNILEEYQTLFHENPKVVVGGFHTAGKGDFDPGYTTQIREMARELKKTGIIFYTCHCTGEKPYQILREELGRSVHYLSTGDTITF